MTLALLDCPTGVAGNMLLAALLDLGVPETVVHAPLAALGLGGRYRLACEERRSGGLRGLHVQVESLESEPPHRAWGDLRQLLEAAPLAPVLRQRVLAVFTLLAEAEAAVHGHAIERVHFHEVGALDALVDVVGVCAGLCHLGVEELVCSPPPAGHGQVITAHGLLPLPAPAVLEIARRRAMPLGSSEGFPAAELTTPTGAALAASWASRFGAHPAATPRQIGIGLGSRTLDRPNLLRLTLAAPAVAEAAPSEPVAGQPGETAESLLIQQAQIDDMSAEDLAFLARALREAGAVEVFSQAVTMKKGRLGTLLTALLAPDRAETVRRVWWTHSASLGVRERLERRWVLARQAATVSTPLGPVRIKWSWQPQGGWRAKPEADDLADLARRHDLPLEHLRGLVREALSALPRPEPPAGLKPGPSAAASMEGSRQGESLSPDRAGTQESLP